MGQATKSWTTGRGVQTGTDGESAGFGNCPQGGIGQSVWLVRSNLSQPGTGRWEQSEGVEMCDVRTSSDETKGIYCVRTLRFMNR